MSTDFNNFKAAIDLIAEQRLDIVEPYDNNSGLLASIIKDIKEKNEKNLCILKLNDNGTDAENNWY